MGGHPHLTRAQARRAREIYHRGGVSQWDLAERLGVSYSVMGYLLRGTTYKNAGGPIGSLGRPPSRKVDPEEARRLRDAGWSYRELCEHFGAGRTTVWKALQGHGTTRT